MTVAETLLVFAGAPLAITAVLAALTLWPRGRKRTRYKSGQPWPYEPVWYEPHPENSAGGHGGGYGAGVPGAGTQAIGSSVYGEPTDSHHPHGAQGSHLTAGSLAAATSPAPRGTGGPLGGARGTW